MARSIPSAAKMDNWRSHCHRCAPLYLPPRAILDRLGQVRRFDAECGQGGVQVVGEVAHAAGGVHRQRLGAAELLDRAELQQAGKPLQASRWAGAVDVVGGTTLASLLAQTRYGGAVATCGLVESPELVTTVMPFILRGVSLLGINSVEAPLVTRDRVWARLERDLDLGLLDSLTETIPLETVPKYASRILAGNTRGRVAVTVASAP